MRAFGPTFFVIVLLLISSSSYAADNSSNVCAVQTNSTGSLTSAKSQFRTQCAGHILVDCDPVNGGGWQCSSGIIGHYSPTVASPSNSAQDSQPSETDVAAPPTPETSGNQPGSCYVLGQGLGNTKTLFSQQCSTFKRNDCDPLGNGRWVCSSDNITSTAQFLSALVSTPIQTTSTDQTIPSENSDPAPATTSEPSAESNPGATETSGSSSENTTTTSTLVHPLNPTVGRLGANDLLVLHYDNCPDRDDGHAIPAGKSIVEKYGINNVLTVNGTCGNSIRNRFVDESQSVMQASWGNSYLDAHNQRNLSVNTAAIRWASTLSNGAHVWVAEGGQSDFTADVVRKIESNYGSSSLKRIHIIQHSAGSTAYNEKFTDAANLAYLKNRTSYQPVANGNVGGNGTADLNAQSSYFVFTARASRFSAEWNAGFDYLPPDCAVRKESCKLDFSDTVEVLYIIGDTQTQSVNDFANNYLK